MATASFDVRVTDVLPAPATAVPAPAADRFELTGFCPSCFASSDGGSWGVGVEGGHCYNCGAGGAITIPRWAVESIRAQASWVGRRYYPGREDHELAEERKALLRLVPSFPGRTATPAVRLEDGAWVPDPGRWDVRQMLPNGWIETQVLAGSAEEAIEATRYHLRYVPQETP